MRLYSAHLIRVLGNKEVVTLNIEGFSPDRKLPKCDVPLNGEHRLDFDKNLFAADGKAQVGASGAKGNGSYTPEWKHHNPEEMVNPNFPVSTDRYVTLAMRKVFYQQIAEFRKSQQKLFQAAAAKTRRDKKMNQQEKTKKIQLDFNRIMIDGIRDKAKELKTGCVHFEPFEIAEDTCPCPLHMDTNEFVRVLEHIVLQSARLTQKHFCEDDNVFVIYSGKDKRNGTVVPNVTAVSAEAPLQRILSLMHSIGLGKITAYFQKRYTPPQGICVPQELDQNSNFGEDCALMFGYADIDSTATSENQLERRLRIIGEVIGKLSPHFSSLCLCLKPLNITWPDGSSESVQEFQDRIISHSYIHILRCLSAALSTWFLKLFRDEHGIQMLGDLFVNIVHRYSLHKSYNTFLFAQVSPFKVKRNMFRFQISPTTSFNIGLYGKNEGGEHTQKIIKEHY